jgi:threonylcarbamoyladenosine tRNA methylthiotransferase CDKAL1
LAEVQPDVVNVSKFFSRPRTPAEKMAALSPEEVKRRSGEVAELCRRISFGKNRAWVGWEGTALFDERGKGESWMGRNFAYKPVVVKGGESLVGRFVPVRVVDAFSSYLEAELV